MSEDLTVEETAKLVGLAPWTVRKKARQSGSNLSGTKIHGKWMFPKSCVRAYLNAERRQGANPGMKALMKAGIEV